MADSADRLQSRVFWRLWMLWVLANVVGCCLGVILPTILLARTEFGTSLSDPLTGTRWWALGLAVGAAQAMALYFSRGKSRHGIASALFWAAGTAVGWGVSYWPGGWGGALIAVLVSGGEPSPGAMAVLGGTVVLLGALFSGGAQQLVWRISLEFRGLWVWWNIVGWLLGFAIAIVIPSAVFSEGRVLEFGLRTGIGGAVVGLVTGWRMARESERTRSLLPPQSGCDVLAQAE